MNQKRRGEIQRMLPRHHKMVDFALAGLSNKAIAEELGMTREAVGLVLNSPIVQDELARRRERKNKSLEEAITLDVAAAKTKLERASLEAATKVESLISSEDESIALKASNSVLDRVFGRALGEDGSKTGTITINTDQVQLLVTAMKESKGEKVGVEDE